MADSSQIAGTGTQHASLPAGTTVQWRDTHNLQADDGSTTAAPITGALTSSSTATRYLEASKFSHSIPAGATINGIALEVDFTLAGNGVQDYDIRISGVTAGLSDNLSESANLPSNTTKTWGGSSELWGKTWTIAELEADTFTAYISATGTSPSNFFSTNIDYVKTIVYYTEAGGGGGGGPDFNIKIGGQSISRIMMGDQPISRVNFGSTQI
jgi:hypothetical protein